NGSAHCLQGSSRIPSGLWRPWMDELRVYLGSTDYLDLTRPVPLITADAAFRREVLEKVPAFDEELGPGRLGYGEDSLFGEQLRRCGFRIEYANDVVVEHHFSPDRLSRENWKRVAVAAGRSRAYVAYHWEH